MRVFDQRMGKLNGNDARASFAEIERYIDYMTEQLDFTMSKINKKIEAVAAAQQAAQQEGEDQNGE